MHTGTHTCAPTCRHAHTHVHTCLHSHIHAQPCTLLKPQLQALTLSLGSRFMVLRGRRTRKTLRDLMVLMSFPLDPLEGRSHTCRQAGCTPVPSSHKAYWAALPHAWYLRPQDGRPGNREASALQAPQAATPPPVGCMTKASSEQTKASTRSAAPDVQGKLGSQMGRTPSHRPSTISMLVVL